MITEKFSASEKRLLLKHLTPYGAIKECAEVTGIHRSTITRLLKTGEATDEIADKMRAYLREKSGSN